MTSKEAIKELKEARDIMRDYDLDESESRLMQAINMGIQALIELGPSNNGVKTELEPCDDCISRKQALYELEQDQYHDEFCEEHNIDHSINMGMVRIRLNELPSVKPRAEKTGCCVYCENIEKNNIRFECYWIDGEGNTASFQDKEKHIVATQIARYCPMCGRKLDYRIFD